MTNEEAAKELMMAYEDLKYMCYMDCGREAAFNKAREALRAEPCEDAISRQAMLNGLASIAKAKAKSDAQKALMGRVMFFTEHLPPVTPKPKTGKWIRQTDDYHDYYECEYCGIAVELDDIKHFCPNCGAKMEGECKDYIPTKEEKSCGTCGQPRNEMDQCIPFKEGKCVEMYEKWIPATKEGESK